MRLVFLVLVIILATSANAASTKVIETEQIIVYVNDKGGVDFFNILGNGDRGNVKAIDFLKALEKAKAWAKQADEANSPDFNKDIKRWPKGNISLNFGHSKNANYISICVGYYKFSTQTCGATEVQFVDEYIKLIQEAPAKLKREKVTSAKFK